MKTKAFIVGLGLALSLILASFSSASAQVRTLPSGSTATLSDFTAVNPFFAADLLGTYTGQLIVSDGTFDSTPDSLTIVAENVFDIDPVQGTIGTELTINGSNFGEKKGKVTIGTSKCKVIEWTDTFIRCLIKKISSTTRTGLNDLTIKLKDKGLEPIVMDDAFFIIAPEIQSIDPDSGEPNREITITGSLFGTKKVKVYMDDGIRKKPKKCKVTSSTMDSKTGNSVLKVLVPKGLNRGLCDVTVVNKVGSDTVDDAFFVDDGGTPANGKVSLNSFYLQYRTYSDNNKNKYRGYLEFSKDGNLIEESDIKKTILEDSSGNPLAISETVFVIDSFYYANWNSSASTLEYQSFPQATSYFALFFPDGSEIPSGNYTYKVQTKSGDILKVSFGYPGREELPWVDSKKMEAEWLSNGDLRLSWMNPLGNYDQLRIFLLDQDGKLIFLAKIPTNMEELTIPSELVQNINDYGVPTSVRWLIETRSYTTEGLNYARGISDEVDIPWSLPPASEGLVAYYPFERNANDESGNGNHGVEYGGIDYDPGVIGQAVEFNDDYIKVSHNDMLNPSEMTVALWIYIVNFEPDVDCCFQIMRKDYSLVFNAYSGEPWNSYNFFQFNVAGNAGSWYDVSSPDNIEIGKWHHIAVTYDGTVLRMFYNGQNTHSTTMDEQMIRNDEDLIIGSPSSPGKWRIRVDELRIYNRPLSAGAIYRLYELR